MKPFFEREQQNLYNIDGCPTLNTVRNVKHRREQEHTMQYSHDLIEDARSDEN